MNSDDVKHDVAHSPFRSPKEVVNNMSDLCDRQDLLFEIEDSNRLDANLAEAKRRLAAVARDVRLFDKHCRKLYIPDVQSANGELVEALERIHNILAK